MAQQPQTVPVVAHPSASGGWVHGLIHGVEVFGVAFLAAIGIQPGHVTRDALISAGIAGVRALFAILHH